MATALAISLLVIVFLSASVGLGGMVCGLVGTDWWVGKQDTDYEGYALGLWGKRCELVYELHKKNGHIHLPTCEEGLKRKFVLESVVSLSTEARVAERQGMWPSFIDLDRIMILLIIGGGLSLIAFLISLCMCCCITNPGKHKWKCSAAMVGLFMLLASFAGLGAVIYAEVEQKQKWITFGHGWSSMMAWVGSAVNLIGSVLAFILSCVKPKVNKDSTAVTYPARASAYMNTGYDKGHDSHQMNNRNSQQQQQQQNNYIPQYTR